MKTTLLTLTLFAFAATLYAVDDAAAPVVTEKAEAAAVEKPAELKSDSVVISTATLKEEVKTSVAPVTAPSTEAAPVTFAAPLQDLIAAHEKEVASLKQTMDRWNAKAGDLLKRQQAVEQDVKAKSQKIAELIKENTKASKKEASRLNKEIPQLNKDIASMKKQLSALNKDLTQDVKEDARDAQTALKEAYQKVSVKLSQRQN